MNSRAWLFGCLLVGGAGAVVWACGPEFPNRLLDDRAKTLKAPPNNSFSFEAAQLAPATDNLRAVEVDAYAYLTDAPEKPNDPDLSAEQLTRIEALRHSASGATVERQGTDLPNDVRAYVAGAVDYARAFTGHCDAERANRCIDFDPKALEQAQAHFQTVLALPIEKAHVRGVWAAYMLGEIHALKARKVADTPAFAKERAAAVQAFEDTQRRALAGASDTQGLAVASFGEQAELSLYAGGKACFWNSLTVADPCAAALAPRDLQAAIALYAAQAGHGSHGAVISLAGLANSILENPTQTAALLEDPLSQRMLVSYALMRRAPMSAGSDDQLDARIRTLVDAIQASGLTTVGDTDRLAALAYRGGHYDLAERMAHKSQSPLASWVQAKLAIQRGDLSAAAQAYAEAAKAFPRIDQAELAHRNSQTIYGDYADGLPNSPPRPSADTRLENDNALLVVGEQGVLAMARGEYIEAAHHLFDAASAVGGDGNVYFDINEMYGTGYASDLAYIAERVLTVDELKSFIDTRVPPAPVRPPVPDHAGEASRYRTPMLLNDHLRWLLARRLMREGRFDAAYAYFPSDTAQSFVTVHDGKTTAIDLVAEARRYATALHDAEHAWTANGRAQAHFTAATIARRYGMELLGYEQAPDFTADAGAYNYDSSRRVQHTANAYLGEAEVTRFNASVAHPNLRFHYRFLAADQALQAADLLPPRSQACAAVLCRASSWMANGPSEATYYEGETDDEPSPHPMQDEREKRFAAYYQRYVAEGAMVDWAGNFGSDCPEPDFAAAQTFYGRQAQRWASTEWPWLLGGIALSSAAAQVWRARRRRQRSLRG